MRKTGVTVAMVGRQPFEIRLAQKKAGMSKAVYRWDGKGDVDGERAGGALGPYSPVKEKPCP